MAFKNLTSCYSCTYENCCWLVIAALLMKIIILVAKRVGYSCMYCFCFKSIVFTKEAIFHHNMICSLIFLNSHTSDIHFLRPFVLNHILKFNKNFILYQFFYAWALITIYWDFMLLFSKKF